MTRDEILEKISGALEDALGVDPDEVTPDAKLQKDLGAESIDMLDISFKLEQTFGIKIPQGDLFPENVSQNPEYVQNGKVTEAGLAEMKAKLPHVDFTEFEKDPKLKNIWDLFTVDVLVRFVERKLNEQGVESSA